MDENDNPLAGYDLSAWDAPPPPAGLADAVVSRARARHSQTVTSEPRSWKKPLAIVGALVAAAAVALFFVFGLERAPVDGRGDVKASIAQRLDLGTTSAMIEAGGELGWRRHGSTIEVTQRRGAATWTVGANDTLVLESGDSGAMGASIEAADASLRVEVRMLNRTDARVLGVGSAVAAIVSVVTVVVYEGHVKATHDGQTVNINPGATAQFPAKIDTPDSQFSVGGGTANDLALRGKERAAGAERAFLSYRPQNGTADCKAADVDEFATMAFDKGLYEKAKELWLQANGCDGDPNIVRKIVIVACALGDKKLADEWVTQAAPPTDQRTLTQLKEVCAARGVDLATFIPDMPDASTCDEVSCVLTNHEGACCEDLKKKTDEKSGDGVKAKVEKPAPTIEKTAPKAEIKSKRSTPSDSDEVSCILNNYEGADCAKHKPADWAEKQCDAAAFKAKGENYLQSGMDAAALAQFESSLRCKSNPSVTKLAYMSACRAKNTAKAKMHFAKIPEAQKAQLLQICTRAGVDPQ